MVTCGALDTPSGMNHPATSLTCNPSKRSLQHRILGTAIRNARRYSDKLRIVCLPGKTGWDVEYFLKHGATEVYAIERDATIANSLKAKFSSDSRVVVINSATCEFFNTAQGQFDIIYLDYYSTFSGMVKADVRILFRRHLIAVRGKLIVAFYAAREAPHDTLEQREDYYALCRFSRSTPEDVTQITQQRMRMLAFNGFIAGFRSHSPALAPPGHPDKVLISTGSPSWWSYETANGTPMLVAETPIYTYGTKSQSSRSVLGSDCWHARGKYATPRNVVIKNITGKHTDVIAYWTERMLQFYKEHSYTPGRRDLGVQNIRDFKGILAKAGLCPRVGATWGDVEAEIRRINEREGYVSRGLLKKAKILRKIEESFGKTVPIVLKEMGIAFRTKKRSRQDYIIKLTKWIQHLLSDKPKMESDLYLWARHKKLLKFKDANETFNRLMARLPENLPVRVGSSS